MTEIGVIGCGVVGLAVVNGFRSRGVKVHTYDKFKKEHSDLRGCLESPVVFVCVPTPTDRVTGAQDLTPLKDVLQVLKDEDYRGVICIKCTLNSGVTAKLSEEYGLKKLVHNPEFLTAANPFEDFLKQTCVLIGGADIQAVLDVADVYDQAQYRNIRIYSSATITEKIKHMRNNYLAVKVSFANEQAEACERLGISYDTVLNGLLAIGGIEPGHFKVGAKSPEGKRGFGGMCFPKDSLAELTHFEAMGVEMSVLKGAVDGNKKRRPEEYVNGYALTTPNHSST